MSHMQSLYALVLTCHHHEGKIYRTRQDTVAGFPELIGKELEIYAKRRYEQIKRGI